LSSVLENNNTGEIVSDGPVDYLKLNIDNATSGSTTIQEKVVLLFNSLMGQYGEIVFLNGLSV
jgi:hypothetical protein